MRIALHRYFHSNRTAARAERDPVVRLAQIAICGTVLVAGGYFVLIYLLALR